MSHVFVDSFAVSTRTVTAFHACNPYAKQCSETKMDTAIEFSAFCVPIGHLDNVSKRPNEKKAQHIHFLFLFSLSLHAISHERCVIWGVFVFACVVGFFVGTKSSVSLPKKTQQQQAKRVKNQRFIENANDKQCVNRFSTLFSTIFVIKVATKTNEQTTGYRKSNVANHRYTLHSRTSCQNNCNEFQ